MEFCSMIVILPIGHGFAATSNFLTTSTTAYSEKFNYEGNGNTAKAPRQGALPQRRWTASPIITFATSIS